MTRKMSVKVGKSATDCQKTELNMTVDALSLSVGNSELATGELTIIQSTARVKHIEIVSSIIHDKQINPYEELYLKVEVQAHSKTLISASDGRVD